MTWGAWGKQFKTDKMQALIDETISLGINTFDHADIYGGYTTEAEFGKAFQQSSVPRESVYFISKCGIQFPCEQRTLSVKHYDYTAKHIRMSVEQSLKNLKTDYSGAGSVDLSISSSFIIPLYPVGSTLPLFALFRLSH